MYKATCHQLYRRDIFYKEGRRHCGLRSLASLLCLCVCVCVCVCVCFVVVFCVCIFLCSYVFCFVVAYSECRVMFYVSAVRVL